MPPSILEILADALSDHYETTRLSSDEYRVLPRPVDSSEAVSRVSYRVGTTAQGISLRLIRHGSFIPLSAEPENRDAEAWQAAQDSIGERISDAATSLLGWPGYQIEEHPKALEWVREERKKKV